MLFGLAEELVYSVLIALLGTHTTDDSSIQLYLSKSANESLTPINATDSPSLDFNKDTFFVIHGFTESLEYHLYPPLCQALLETGVNVIFVDWRNLAKFPNYIAAVENVELVGTFLAKYIIKHKFYPEKVKIVGFSLGAHVGGKAGKVVKAQGGLINRIFGLEAAGPMYGLFEPISDRRRLAQDDAQLVVTLCTNAYFFGTRFEFGKVHFIANFGILQPGCFLLEGVNIMLCSHRRAVELFTDIFNKPTRYFVGHKLTEFWVKSNVTLVFGTNISDSAVGTYQFDTNSESPFALE